ncbi:hypothetical protein FOIG_00807 [Fusarium odoratissimum NRRL 54006]|uniref:Uncharacterized protein n=1 Tax=Fusarium odoratissimum (strain NRRL 54006) TaxID=1089451 RepID=X0KBN8_FUSO5|nr:uncharacterized protein FOIG_00807 [Fusarium odoratissimum NRRL 54006]EXM10908.1 hypothetical protein FOIG_00807 [Fusarium odoratissimum NRRL 54006]
MVCEAADAGGNRDQWGLLPGPAIRGKNYNRSKPKMEFGLVARPPEEKGQKANCEIATTYAATVQAKKLVSYI